MLKGRGRDPDIIGGDRRALFFQLGEDGAVIFRGIFIHMVQLHPGGVEKRAEFSAVFLLPAPRLDPGQQFADGDGRDADMGNLPQDSDHGGVPSQRPGIDIRVDEDPVHFQSSPSMRRSPSIRPCIASNSSGDQAPKSWSRSWY